MNTAEKAHNTTSELDLGSFKILIVDDEPINIELLSEILEDAGYQQIITTSNPVEVISLYQQHQPDLVLLDLKMPQMHGLEVLKLLKQEDPSDNLPVFILTADNNQSTRIESLEAGAKDFVTKPFDSNEITARINNQLQTRFQHLELSSKNQSLDLLVKAKTQALVEKQSKLEKLNLQLEARVDQRTSALKVANKKLQKNIDSIAELVSIVSHEFRTPLTSIKGFAEILRDDDSALDDESRNQFLTIIDSEASRLNRLITDLLDLQKMSAGKMNWQHQPVDLISLINDCILIENNRYKEKALELKLDCSLSSIIVSSDKDKLHQVLINLLSNAYKFTAEGGVTIKMEIVQQWAEIVLLSNDIPTIGSCTLAAKKIGAKLLSFKNANKLSNYLQIHGGKTALLLVDIGNNQTDQLAMLQHVRVELPFLNTLTIALSNNNSGQQVVNIGTEKENKTNSIELLMRNGISNNPSDNMIKISVTDTGTGIPDDEINNVFARFHQVDCTESRENIGSGLGLAISKEIIEHYQGKIWLESVMGEGSTFIVLLPEAQIEKKRLGAILIEKGLITEAEINDALKDQS